MKTAGGPTALAVFFLPARPRPISRENTDISDAEALLEFAAN